MLWGAALRGGPLGAARLGAPRAAVHAQRGPDGRRVQGAVLAQGRAQEAFEEEREQVLRERERAVAARQPGPVQAVDVEERAVERT